MDLKKPRRARFQRYLPSLVPALLALSGAGASGQEKTPYYVGAAQAFTHESNVFRSADDGSGVPKTSDWHSTTSVSAGLDQPIGRQRLYGDVTLRHTRYGENRQLDNSGGSVLLAADWSALDLLNGRISLAADRSLARYSPDSAPAGFNDLNVQNTQEFLLRGMYGFEALLAVEGAFVHRRLDFSAPVAAVANNEFEQDSLSLGVKLRPGGPLTLGLAYRRTEGSFLATPAGGADDFNRDDLDLTLNWVATGQSTITARLSRTKERHEVVTSRNLSGTTGALGWIYKPTGKLEFGLDLVRDTGAETAFGLGGAPVADASLLSTTLLARVQYEVTAKVQALLAARQQRRDLVDPATGNKSNDDTSEFRLGLNWSPLRSLAVGCSVGRETRDASLPSLSYSASFARCLATFKTQ